jgi:CDGSH-type Zn-finger protein
MSRGPRGYAAVCGRCSRVAPSAMSEQGTEEAADAKWVPFRRRRRQPGGGAVVAVYEDGPLIIRGEFAIMGQDGRPIPAGRRTVALCRCGRSAIKPFCDGSHARSGFRAPGGAQGARAAQDGDGSGGPGQPVAGVGDTAAQPAGEREPAAD